MEAEYTALSAALRVFLPLEWLIQEMLEKTRSEPLEDINLLSTVFEDKQPKHMHLGHQPVHHKQDQVFAS